MPSWNRPRPCLFNKRQAYTPERTGYLETAPVCILAGTLRHDGGTEGLLALMADKEAWGVQVKW